MMVLTLTVIIFQVRSLSAMALVLATAPLGLIGAVPSLLLTQQPSGFNAILGLIGLSGILMRNTLILIGQIHTNEAEGLHPYDAVVEATVQRARPVILTALAAVLAFIPLTTSVFWGSMAVTLIGGTAVGTVLVLVFLPALYALWFRVRSNVVLAAARQPVGDAKTAMRHAILYGPVLPTMVRLALPMIAVLLVQTGVGIAETVYVGFLGSDALAGVALVFPVLMLMTTMSNGGIGGGVSSAIARAIGAGRQADANALVWHAAVLSVGIRACVHRRRAARRAYPLPVAGWPRSGLVRGSDLLGFQLRGLGPDMVRQPTHRFAARRWQREGARTHHPGGRRRGHPVVAGTHIRIRAAARTGCGAAPGWR